MLSLKYLPLCTLSTFLIGLRRMHGLVLKLDTKGGEFMEPVLLKKPALPMVCTWEVIRESCVSCTFRGPTRMFKNSKGPDPQLGEASSSPLMPIYADSHPLRIWPETLLVSSVKKKTTPPISRQRGPVAALSRKAK